MAPARTLTSSADQRLTRKDLEAEPLITRTSYSAAIFDRPTVSGYEDLNVAPRSEVDDNRFWFGFASANDFLIQERTVTAA